jgi:hypothetical protein
MKREIYITIFLFALMLVALAAAVVRAQHSVPSQYSSDAPQKSYGDYIEKTTFGAVASYDEINAKPNVLARIIGLRFIPYFDKRPYHGRTSAVVCALLEILFENRGLQVVNWSGR